MMATAVVPVCAEPVRLILDTDMQTDCDDVAALGVLHALADNGEVEILATIVGVLNPWSAPCTDAINTYYGRPNIPMGQLKGSSGVNLTSLYAQGVAQGFPQDTGSATNVADATTVYRQILANEADHGVVILSLGYMTNLTKLLHSPADSISPLTGAQLIQQKVKTWICMGGNFPNDYLLTAQSDNVNFRRDPASVIDCVNNWPGPIEFVGREIGHNMQAGARLTQTPTTNPVRRAYELFFGGTAKDQHCADIAAVLYAVRGTADYWNMQTTGSMFFTNTSAWFQWVASPDLNQSYVLAKMSPTIIQELLEDLMIQPPGTGQSRPTASIALPTSGQRFAEGAPVTITANASDSNGTVAKVEFFDGLKKIGEVTGAPYSLTWSSTVAGTHRLSVKVTDNEFGSTISAPLDIIIGQTNEGAGTGLTGQYYDNVDFTGLKLTRVDSTVNFSWGSGSPDASIGVDTFSVRWTGAVLPVHSTGTQSYTFYTNTNDGLRLWVDEQLIIDDLTNGPLREKSGTIALEAGKLHTIRFDYFENTNTAQAELRWETAGVTKQIIPRTQLFPQANQTPTANNDAADADRDLPVSVPVLANDSDPDLAPAALQIQSAQTATPGASVMVSGAAVIYTPPSGFLGTDSFTYVVSDGQANATGTVSVTVHPWTTFAPFQERYFTPEQLDDSGISGWYADPDKDGVPNGVEYSQDTDPTKPNAPVPAAMQARNGYCVLTYRKRKGATDHLCQPQVSSDLINWQSGPGFIEETVVSEDASTQVIEARDLTPITGTTRRFMRLQVDIQF